MKRVLKRVGIVILAVLVGYLAFDALGASLVQENLVTINYNDLGLKLLTAFGTGIVVITAYTGIEAYYEDDRQRRINDLTQTYTGIILILSIIGILVTAYITDWTIEDLYIVFATTVLILSLLTMKRYNALIEEYA